MDNSRANLDRAELAGLGRRIRHRREAAALTLDRLAAQAGIAPAALEAVEAGLADPAFTTLCRMARALGCPVAALLDAAFEG
jgi:transcriptional regulator with XRE-family HTH domain